MSDMYYTLKVAGLTRQLPLCPLSDDRMIAAFVIFGDMELTTACARELNARIPEHDVMITAESKGIPLICEMARLAGELGITLKQGYNGDIAAKDAGHIGGNMVKKMIEAQERQMSGK